MFTYFYIYHTYGLSSNLSNIEIFDAHNQIGWQFGTQFYEEISKIR